MRYSVLLLTALAALGTEFEAHAHPIPVNIERKTLVDRDPAIIPIIPVIPKPKPIIPKPPPKPVVPILPPRPVQPAPIPAPKPVEPKPQRPPPPNRANPELPAPIVTDPEELARLKNWKCGTTKRGENLFKRAGPFKDEDTANSKKYLEWLETMAKDGEGKRIPRDKIIFFTKGTYKMADAFIEKNPEYTHWHKIFERDSSFMKDWNYPEVFEKNYFLAQSTAMAEYARNPLVFGADRTLDPTDKRVWAKNEYPYMHEAGTITKMKDNALTISEVDYMIDPPEQAPC